MPRMESLEGHDFPWESFGEFLETRMVEYRVDEEIIHHRVRMTRKVLRALIQNRYEEFPPTVINQLKQVAPLLRLREERLLNLFAYYQNSHIREEREQGKRKTKGDIRSFMWIWISGLGAVILILFAALSMTVGKMDQSNEMVSSQESPLGPDDILVTQLMDQLELGIIQKQDPVMTVGVKVVESTWIHVEVDDCLEYQELLLPGDSRQWRAREVVRIKTGTPETIEIFRDKKPIEHNLMKDGSVAIRIDG